MLRKKTRTKRVKKAVPIAPPKPKRPHRGELKRIYKAYLTSDIGQRIQVLVRALDWYDKAYVYVKYKMDHSNRKMTRGQLAALNCMFVARSKSISLSTPEYKLRTYIEAIQSYERALKGYKAPTFHLVNKIFSRKEKKLSVRRKNLTDKYDRFIVTLQDMLHPVTVENKKLKLQVDRLNAPYNLDAEGHLTFDRKLVSALKKTARQKGVFAAVLQLLPVLSEAASSEAEIDNTAFPTGRRIVNWQMRYHAVLVLLNNLYHYCQKPEAPRTLIRRAKEEK
jgi:hypothetical protein